ncbi:MAG: sulfatase-like hydrolase/transferase [bacterium]|nr:sulfatase-like hydrolase/transferase [bacterium]
MSDRPNLLFIVTDQQFAGAMSCAGNSDLHTPAMDRLAETGVRFERAYCPQPLCAPCRASFMTGFMPHQTGIISNGGEMREDLRTRGMGNLLRAGGYACAYAGKWHVPSVTMEGFGYQVLLSGNDDAGVPLKCLEFLKERPEEPFFLVASFINPHDICQVARNQPLPQGEVADAPIEECPSLPQNFAIPPFAPDALEFLRRASNRVYPTTEYNDEDWRHLRQLYYRLCEKVDSEIGVLLDGLRELGLEEDTVVIFVSDHGDGHGAHHWNQKTALWEECIHIPFIVSQKGTTQAGGVDESHLVSLGLDLVPTLCDYAGVDVPEDLAGASVRALAEGRAPSDWRNELVVETQLGLGSGPGGDMIARALVTEQHKYSVYPIGRYREQLVNLETDSGEMVNLAVDAKYRDVLDDHRKRLLAWCEETEDPFRRFCVR